MASSISLGDFIGDVNRSYGASSQEGAVRFADEHLRSRNPRARGARFLCARALCVERSGLRRTSGPLHICEVVLRNAVSDALERVYGARWPWSIGFEQSLPAPRLGYSPRRDLQNARTHAATTGKAIPELKFVYWQKMFTGRHDTRVWNTHLLGVMPNLDSSKTISQLRQQIYDDLEKVRELRNRIAHHEPIFTRNLTDDLQRMVSLIEHRCKITAEWMLDNQQASALISARPTL
jgi:hypothetical protein